MLCRWDTNDLAFSEMPSSRSCSVDEGLITCNLPLQTEGQHIKIKRIFKLYCNWEVTLF
ncbi:MAG: hypothetical protein AABX96_03610 [Nanoarchaeota archaeon]